MQGDACRVLHVLNTSLPLVNGYALRTHGMLRALLAAGVEASAVSSPFHPGTPELVAPTVIDGVVYHRCPHPLDDSSAPMRDRLARPTGRLRLRVRRNRLTGGVAASPVATSGRGPKLSRPMASLRRCVAQLEQAVLVPRFARTIAALVDQHRIQVLHAHSPARGFEAAYRVARRVGLPIIYEIRGFQELTAVAEGALDRNDPLVKVWTDAHTRAMHLADRVVVLGQAMCDEVVARGIPREKIGIVRNACTPDAPSAAATPDVKRAAAQLAAGPGLRIGYVGAVQRFEGIHTLIDAAAQLRARSVDVRVLIAGPDWIGEPLDRQISGLGLEDIVVRVGATSPDEATALLDLLDVCVVPRIDSTVTRLVTPLKPLDAMARGCCVVLSDLPASRELVEDGRTGLLVPPGDVEALVEMLENLAGHPETCQSIGEASRAWVTTHRTWNQAAEQTCAAQRCVLEGGGSEHR